MDPINFKPLSHYFYVCLSYAEIFHGGRVATRVTVCCVRGHLAARFRGQPTARDDVFVLRPWVVESSWAEPPLPEHSQKASCYVCGQLCGAGCLAPGLRRTLKCNLLTSLQRKKQAPMYNEMQTPVAGPTNTIANNTNSGDRGVISKDKEDGAADGLPNNDDNAEEAVLNDLKQQQKRDPKLAAIIRALEDGGERRVGRATALLQQHLLYESTLFRTCPRTHIHKACIPTSMFGRKPNDEIKKLINWPVGNEKVENHDDIIVQARQRMRKRAFARQALSNKSHKLTELEVGDLVLHGGARHLSQQPPALRAWEMLSEPGTTFSFQAVVGNSVSLSWSRLNQ
ncbi:hypothetical protein B566_EDAN016013 [Ephemera danica]|nr:hypothetical protein B566_EDAN016013 [Ephemera danica]